MPKVDGLEVCRQLRADPTFPFTPIIMVTAKADPKDVVAGLEAGGDEYLTKPVDQTALVARVSQRLLGAVEALAESKPVGDLSPKGFSKPVPAFNVVGLRPTSCRR